MNFENESLNFMSEVENLLKTRMNLTDKNVYETIKVTNLKFKVFINIYQDFLFLKRLILNDISTSVNN
jgi:hypothetical protein